MATAAIAEPSAHFPDLLRSWRKLRKLSQWDLSLSAGISQRHLSFLESGRSNPSREMVLKLANSLEVPLEEQNTLLGSAGFAPMFRQQALDDDSMKQATQALQIMLEHHEPYPCLVVDNNWNMLMSNNANIQLFAQFVDPIAVWSKVGDDGSSNLARLVLHPDGLKPFIKNWSLFANYFLHNLQQELRSNPYALTTRALLDEIMSYPDLPSTDVGVISSPLPFLAMEMSGNGIEVNLFSMVSSFGQPHDVTLQQLRIETFFPADEKSEAFIRNMMTH